MPTLLDAERVAFLAAIVAVPEDDSSRLVYADWLGDHGEIERGEFIRTQIELTRREAAHLPADDPCACLRDEASLRAYQSGVSCGACRRRNEPIAELRARVEELWGPPDTNARLALGVPVGWDYGIAVAPTELGPHALIRRGFVSAVTCPAADWLAHADALHWHPTQTVKCAGPPEHNAYFQRPVHDTNCRGGCSGTGRVPRHCPETAQPINSVTLTTRMGWTLTKDGVSIYAAGTDQYRRLQCSPPHNAPPPNAFNMPSSDYLLLLFRAEWPGITFTLQEGH